MKQYIKDGVINSRKYMILLKKKSKYINMKTIYIKDGEKKYRNQIVLRTTKTIKDKNGNNKEVKVQVINPNDKLLTEHGWVKYELPVVDELTQTLLSKIKEINKYDTSTAVNSFYINDIEVWLDKSTRTGLMLRFQSELALGDIMTTLWYGDMEFILPLNTAMQMLYALEKYASQCYDNTKKHLSEVKKLTTIEDINNYDYTTGYPEKLKFNY